MTRPIIIAGDRALFMRPEHIITCQSLMKRTRALLYTPEQWTSGKYFATADDQSCEMYHPERARCCLSGALRVASCDLLDDPMLRTVHIGLLHRMLCKLISRDYTWIKPYEFYPITILNDVGGYVAVSKLIDETLGLLLAYKFVRAPNGILEIVI